MHLLHFEIVATEVNHRTFGRFKLILKILEK